MITPGSTNPLLATADAGGYQIQRSLRFNSADSAYLNRSLTTPTDNKKFTMSLWTKRSAFAAYQDILSVNSVSFIAFTNGDVLDFPNAGGRATTSAVFRDPSAWYHIVCVFDSANATANDRMIIYVNNVRQSLGTNTTPSLNATGSMNSAAAHYIGSYVGSSEFVNGYMADVHFIDGQALTPSSFGETDTDTGVWKPKAYSGSYGTNGFYLKFADNSGTTSTTLGKDSSGNGNNWTPNNFSVTAGAGNDSLVDTPTPYGTDTGAGGNVRGNYATLNPLQMGSGITLSNGNLDASSTAATGIAYATIGVSSGKWYWEVTASGGNDMIGISKEGGIFDWRTANGYAYFSVNGQKYTNNSGSSYGASFITNDVIGVALDMDAGTLAFYKNGSSQGTAYSSLSGTYFPSVQNGGAATVTPIFNFGQRPFAYTAPSGFKALCTQNLPTPTIGATATTQAGQYFNPVIYTGNGGSSQAITVGFSPDLVWIKSRSNVTSHGLYDRIRGVQKWIGSNSTSAEQTYTGTVESFDSNGFTVGSDLWNGANNYTYVAWNWKANGAGSSNTAGTITSTVSANTTAGFSIVTWTANGTQTGTVGHGLGVAPKFIIYKKRNGTSDWYVWITFINGNEYLLLNATNGSASLGSTYGSPTSTTISNYGWANGDNMLAYCFAEVAGYSKFGTYTGNASTDGPFVFTGFRPAFVLIKRSNGADDWFTFDSKRLGYNVRNEPLFPNTSGAEGSGYDYIDLLSNGFKMKNNSFINNSTVPYLYAAFAEVPQKFSLAR